MRLVNLFASPSEALPEEIVEELARGQGVRVERIVSRGHVSGWYDQVDHEWVALLAGEARLEFEGGEIRHLLPGDHLMIPAHRRHRVAWTTPERDSVWLAVHFQPE